MLQNYHPLYIYAYVNPIVAVLGAVIFGETLTIAIGIGGLITLSGLYMVNHSIKKTSVFLLGIRCRSI
jgi:drug/metabolite transporter (DMT)-like permease